MDQSEVSALLVGCIIFNYIQCSILLVGAITVRTCD